MENTLSILIPARNEIWLARTVEDILANIEGNTEIIVVLDGAWDDPKLPNDKRVKVIFNHESVGQRAATNQACRISRAKYVMKVDAHCAFDKGFDVKMMADMQDNWTMIPVLRNLHVFDWVCPKASPRISLKGGNEPHRRYQSPSGPCIDCGEPTERDVVWIAKTNPENKTFRFDRTLHFQYWKELARRQKGDLIETMSIQGSCFMLTREKYWELNICDESWGSWGQQGVEVALKTWLSGGRVICTKKTWYAHLFRTQGRDFAFPYHNPESQIEKIRNLTRDLFFNDKWEKAIYPFSWILEKFAPVPDFDTNKEIIFYTDNQLTLKIAHKVQKQLRNVGLPILSVSLKPMAFGKNIHLPLKRGIDTYFKQIITALENSTAEIVFFCEHDVLYHPSHFKFIPTRKDTFYYNHNVWRWKYPTNLAVTWKANQVAELCCYRELALEWYRNKAKEVEFNRSYEPNGRTESWMSEYPNIDIRHGDNLTKSKWSIDDFRDKSSCIDWKETTVDKIKGWDNLVV